MKRLLISAVLLLAFSSVAYGGGLLTLNIGEAERTYQGDGHFYIIHFTYDAGLSMIPATSPVGQLHYSALITVSEIVNGAKKEIATFNGQYTERGCFEDDPQTLVEMALKMKKKVG
jgi:hypothetical protein